MIRSFFRSDKFVNAAVTTGGLVALSIFNYHQATTSQKSESMYESKSNEPASKDPKKTPSFTPSIKKR